MAMIPYGHQDISESDIQAVVDVLRSDFLTQGPAVPTFEKIVAEYCGAQHAVAVNSATSALHIACLGLGVGPGDWVWTSPNTFVASANCARYCGADVDFVDIDPRTYNMSVTCLEEKLAQAVGCGRLPKVVIPVHLCGQPCEMQAIHTLSKQYGFRIIEDASHALGGCYQDAPIGNGRYSDITVFSFHPVKIITAGEGGMALTNNPELDEKLRLLRSHGITRDPAKMVGESHGAWYYQQIELGFNYRMTEMQAALGASQMARLDEFIRRRHEIADLYNDTLGTLSLTIPWQHPDSYSAFHLYPIRVSGQEKRRQNILSGLRAAGISANVHYIPVHTQPYYKRIGFKEGDFVEAERYYQEAISLPIYYALSSAQQGEVIEALNGLLQ